MKANFVVIFVLWRSTWRVVTYEIERTTAESMGMTEVSMTFQPKHFAIYEEKLWR
ncbi:hypothetical protein Scep_015571 [Stephania cephalantha]|uniref:Uncharacterized protein n=1 Tax=Stephania cephalantha TaxID=152367 RepID=A0AAP0J480_9MAGN